jgi:seryl-tRNA synthetase
MLQLHILREETARVIDGLTKRNFKEAKESVSKAVEIDKAKRALQTQIQEEETKLNLESRKVGELMKAGKQEEAMALRNQIANSKDTAKENHEKLKGLERELTDLLYKIPNVPAAKVPAGKSPEENKVEYEHGIIPTLHEGALPHWELIKKYDIIDFDLGIKIAGAGFPVYKGKGAKLQRALINFFLSEAEKAGYTEMQPPIVVNEASGYGTGQLPDKEGQMYFINEDGLYLIPTAEVPITNLYRDVMVSEDELPIKNAGYTPCFRREAGSWGAHVRGLNRLHQFDKIEIVQIAKPENSYEILEEMSKHVASLLEKLELPHRRLLLCGGDMGFNSAMTYDFEVFSAAQQRWLEVSSVSNFETFQANRLKLRYKNKDGKTQLLHTLNGSALALPRIVAAILENNQTKDWIRIPKVLVPWTGFEWIINGKDIVKGYRTLRDDELHPFNEDKKHLALDIEAFGENSSRLKQLQDSINKIDISDLTVCVNTFKRALDKVLELISIKNDLNYPLSRNQGRDEQNYIYGKVLEVLTSAMNSVGGFTSRPFLYERGGDLDISQLIKHLIEMRDSLNTRIFNNYSDFEEFFYKHKNIILDLWRKENKEHP